MSAAAPVVQMPVTSVAAAINHDLPLAVLGTCSALATSPAAGTLAMTTAAASSMLLTAV